MSLLATIQKLWRYKLATLPIIGLVLAGAIYTVAFKAPVYESDTTYILFSPPPPPTASQIQQDPAIARGTDNPYTRFSDLSVVAQLLATRLTSDETRRALAKRGAYPNYTAVVGGGFGYSTPTLLITGTGPNAQGAVTTADVVGRELAREVEQMQEARGVAPKYRITTQPVVAAHDAKLKPSGKLRALFGVLALGAVLLFFVVSILEAVAGIRSGRGSDGDNDVIDLPNVGPPIPGMHDVRPARRSRAASGRVREWR